ncbi:DUF1552 domain-containing protein [Psychromonas sp.]|nr:DUF1552 domain-containing protein [Psychromonas sp.]
MKKTMSKQNMDRRAFLRTVAGAGLSMKFLAGSTFATGMMLSRSAQAADTSTIKRVICVFIPGGAPVVGTNLWLPSTDLILPQTTAPLESVKDKCIFFENAVIADSGGAETGGHGNTSKAFGGQGFDNSWDVEMERTLGANSSFSSLLLGVQSNGHGSATKKNGTEVSYQDNPVAAFDRVFGGTTAVAGSVEVQRQQSVLDMHKAELDELKTVLGTVEQDRLNEHLASVEKIESRIIAAAEATVSGECLEPTWNTGGFEYDSANKTRFATESELQMDTAVLALSCGMTNVVSIMLGNHQSEHAIPTLNFTGDYHQSIHGGVAGNYEETRTYLTERLAYLIQKLAAAKDENGNSLLDSTLVIQSTDMGDGNAHSSIQAPVMMAGGGSALNGGSIVDSGAHTNVFDTATEILGLTGSVTQFGTGALTGVIA